MCYLFVSAASFPAANVNQVIRYVAAAAVRRRIRKRSGRIATRSKTACRAVQVALAETWKGSQAGRISARSFLPRLHRARLICPARSRARWKESARTRYERLALRYAVRNVRALQMRSTACDFLE